MQAWEVQSETIEPASFCSGFALNVAEFQCQVHHARSWRPSLILLSTSVQELEAIVYAKGFISSIVISA